MKRKTLLVSRFWSTIAVLSLAGVALYLTWLDQDKPKSSLSEAPPSTSAPGYAGSTSCRECHEKFYQLWATSHHGLAMQPFTPEFARGKLTAQNGEITIGPNRYQAETTDKSGLVRESGPAGVKEYAIDHVLGGKNVYYFLTPMDRGHLQVLPLGYDVRLNEWFDAAGSMIRHFTDQKDEALPWTDQALTFNSACYHCHVSQLSTNYDLKTDTYSTVWAEPGINCETCHGPAAEHNRVCRAAPKGQAPKDLKITRGGRDFTVAQNNATCAPCHAKMVPLTSTFKPGDRFFDHFDLVTLEDRDFYPDGRDLGENYTYTLWLTSPCVKTGRLSCLHCHTSSGRYKFKGEAANQACLPCHERHVRESSAHTHHPAGSPGNNCVDCHMPMTEFARMRRTDHSMRPPTPAVSMRYGSPNACRGCHQDHDDGWADRLVREWRQRDYQAPVLYRTGLIDAARKRDWSRLPEMLTYLTSSERDEVYVTSLIRLLAVDDDQRKWPVLRQTLNDSSPLIRAAAAIGLSGDRSLESRQALLNACRDDYRLVRIRAAAALSLHPWESMTIDERLGLEAAEKELLTALDVQPDNWTSHYNLGNYYSDRGELPSALRSFEAALKLRPTAVPPLINASLVHARLGQVGMAEELLRQALKIDEGHPAANVNLGLLLAEKGEFDQAEGCFRRAMESDPSLPDAPYNLAVLLSRNRLGEAIGLAHRAVHLRPTDVKYNYTLAFYLKQAGQKEEAGRILSRMIADQPEFAGGYMLLGMIYEEDGRIEEAKTIYRQALSQVKLYAKDRKGIEERLRTLSAR